MLQCYVRHSNTAREVSKYGVFSGLYFPVFGLNTGKYGAEKTPHLDTFHAVALNITVNTTLEQRN